MSENQPTLGVIEEYERKIAFHLDALKQGETLYRNLVQLAPDAFITADQNGQIQFVNQAAEQLFGMTAKEMKGLCFIQLFAADEAEPINHAWKLIEESNDHSQRKILEIKALKRNAAVFPADVSLAAITIGKTVFFTAIIRDISERKMAETEMKLLKTGLESAANAIVITDRTGVIRWINPAFTTLTGYSFAECQGRTLNLLKSGQHDLSFYKEMWATILRGQVWRGEISNRCRDGSILFVEQTITPVLDLEGNITHFIGVKQDITDRKRAEVERENLITSLQGALAEVKILHGMLPICCACKKIRDDKGYWQNVESYIESNSRATFSHSMCPDCIQKFYPQYQKKNDKS